MRAGRKESPASLRCAREGARIGSSPRFQTSQRAQPGRPSGAEGPPSAHRACAGSGRGVAGGISTLQGFPVAREWRGGNAGSSAHASSPVGGPGNPHPPQCARGRGGETGSNWSGVCLGPGGGGRREREQGLPQVPAPALAVALATWRAGCSAEAASGKPDCSAPAWSSAPVAGVSLRAPGGSAGEDAGRRGEGGAVGEGERGERGCGGGAGSGEGWGRCAGWG